MDDDFNLDKSRWYNGMKIGLSCKYIVQNAEVVTERARILAGFPYDAATGTELAKAETALTEALLAVQVARQSYERVTMEAAE